MKRTLWEVVVVVILIAALFGLYLFKEEQAERSLEEQAAGFAAERTGLEARAEAWARALAESEAEAVLRAFAAGTHESILSDRRDTFAGAIDQLVQLERVVFVHLLAADGRVLAGSDRKLVTTGDAGEGGAWAITAVDEIRRRQIDDGIAELALPIVRGAQPAAFLWLGYAAGELQAAARPPA